MQAITSATAKITASSGLTLMPRVSSSKNLNSPALWGGMGDLLSRFFPFLLLMIGFPAFYFLLLLSLEVLLIKVMPSFICVSLCS